MLQIIVRGKEVFDEATGTFYYPNETTLNLEHSLVSISKWESKWHKPFFSKIKHTEEETRDYIRCMTINKNVDPMVYNALNGNEINAIIDYIEDSCSAMYHDKKKNGGSREEITSEKIYFWMFSYRIPKECEKWHISRLLNVIELFNDANTPPKKRRPKEIAQSYASLNAQRRKALGTRG